MGYYSRLSKKKTTDKWGKSYASSYWYDDYSKSFDYYDRYTSWGVPSAKAEGLKKSANLYKLASVRRAIANFVQIVTGKNIPVTFATKSDSKTDGKRVILSADVDDNFDVSVGLALHEGSHIVLSQFELLAEMAEAKRYFDAYRRGGTENDEANYSPAVFTGGKFAELKKRIFHPKSKIRSKSILTEELYGFIMGMSNWIEDRRIDNWIYKSAPGYRNYYVSMYDHYFNDKLITKGIESDEFTDETLDSYLFRLVNLLNEKTDLDKLKGLRRIAQMLDLKRIDRIRSSAESLSLAVDITEVMLEYIMVVDKGTQPKEEGDGEGEGEGEGEPEMIDDLDGYDISESDGTGKGKQVRLSPKALEQLKKKIEKQKQFLNGDVKKKQVSKTELQSLENIEQSGTEIQKVGQGYERSGGKIGKGVDCIIVKRLTDKMIEDEGFPCANKDYSGSIRRAYVEEVKRGTELGVLLGKKLQVRSESRETIFSRLKSGRIDKRMIASLGYDNESVFFNHHIDQFKKVNLHISIDYSGSMNGHKIRQTITSVVAIVKACIMARNIDVQVSIRTTAGRPELPWIALVYDSKRNTFKQFCKYMEMLEPHNTTPEGLCFEAIHKYLIPQTNDMDSYFLNFSDGQPSYSISHGDASISYGGDSAAEHTNKQIKRMNESGIVTLAYFITEYSGERFESTTDWRVFKRSYGADAKYVNVSNMMEVAKSMNEMFLKKTK